MLLPHDYTYATCINCSRVATFPLLISTFYPLLFLSVWQAWVISWFSAMAFNSFMSAKRVNPLPSTATWGEGLILINVSIAVHHLIILQRSTCIMRIDLQYTIGKGITFPEHWVSLALCLNRCVCLRGRLSLILKICQKYTKPPTWVTAMKGLIASYK